MAIWFGLIGSSQNKIMQEAFQDGLASGVPVDGYSRMEKFVADWLYNRGYFGNAVNGKRAKKAVQAGDYNAFWKIGSNETQQKELHKWVDNAKAMAVKIANEKAAGQISGTTMQQITNAGDAAQAKTTSILPDNTIKYIMIGVAGIVGLVLIYKLFSKKGK